MPEFKKKASDYDAWFAKHPGLFQSELAANGFGRPMNTSLYVE